MFSTQTKPSKYFHGRDLKQFRRAERKDAEAHINRLEIIETAQKNEEKFVKILYSYGIKMKSQEELVEEQQAEFGRALLTRNKIMILLAGSVLFQSSIDNFFHT